MGKDWLKISSLAPPFGAAPRAEASLCPLRERAMSKQTKPSIISALPAGSGPVACDSAIDPSLRAEEHDVIAGQYGLDTFAGEFVRTDNGQAHEIIDAIAAVVLDAQAGLNDGTRAGDIVVRTRALMKKVAAADGAADP